MRSSFPFNLLFFFTGPQNAGGSGKLVQPGRLCSLEWGSRGSRKRVPRHHSHAQQLPHRINQSPINDQLTWQMKRSMAQIAEYGRRLRLGGLSHRNVSQAKWLEWLVCPPGRSQLTVACLGAAGCAHVRLSLLAYRPDHRLDPGSVQLTITHRPFWCHHQTCQLVQQSVWQEIIRETAAKSASILTQPAAAPWVAITRGEKRNLETRIGNPSSKPADSPNGVLCKQDANHFHNPIAIRQNFVDGWSLVGSRLPRK